MRYCIHKCMYIGLFVARNPAQRMIKIRRLLELMEYKVCTAQRLIRRTFYAHPCIYACIAKLNMNIYVTLHLHMKLVEAPKACALSAEPVAKHEDVLYVYIVFL